MPRAQLDEYETNAKTMVKICTEKADRPHTEDQEIPATDARTISDAWDAWHDFTLTDSQILTPFQQGKLWREYGMSPKNNQLKGCASWSIGVG